MSKSKKKYICYQQPAQYEDALTIRKAESMRCSIGARAGINPADSSVVCILVTVNGRQTSLSVREFKSALVRTIKEKKERSRAKKLRLKCQPGKVCVKLSPNFSPRPKEQEFCTGCNKPRKDKRR